MFDRFKPNQEEAGMIAAEKRQYEFAAHQQALNRNEMIQDELILNQNEHKQDLIRWQQDLTDDLDRIKHLLKSEMWTGEKWVKMPQGTDKKGKPMYIPPLMNDMGIQRMMSLFDGMTSKNLINSFLKEEDIYKSLKNTCDAAVITIARNFNNWSIDFENLPIIMRMFRNTIKPTPFRALDGIEKKYNSMITKRTEAFSEVSQKDREKQGMFSNIFAIKS